MNDSSLEIMVNNKKIDIRVKKSLRAKHLRLTIYPDGEAVATLPHHLPLKYLIKFISSKSSWLEKSLQKLIVVPSYSSEFGRNQYLKYREPARKIIIFRLKHFAHIYGYSYNRVTIRNQKTRWGSCSSKKNLNFNYKIYFLPKELRDYIIVHEVCHLRELNHSVKFWRLVSQVYPQHKEIRKRLKEQNFKL